jgi:hypothetical protein
MIFLSFLLARPATKSTPTDPISHPADAGPCAADLPDPPDLPAPADSTTHTRESGVLGRWRISRSPYRAFVPAVRLCRRTPPSPPNSRTMGMGSSPSAAIALRHVRLDPAVLARESMPDSCIAEINRKVTNRSPPRCRGSILRPDLTPGTGISRHVADVRARATMRACDVPSSSAGMIGRNDTTHEPCHSPSSVLSVACGAGLRR